MRFSFLTLATLALSLGACNGDKTDTSGSGTGGTSGEGEEENHRPVADAGADVTQDSLEAVGLDARASYDPDGDALTFFWSFDRVPEGSVVTDREAPFSENYGTETSTTFRPDVVGTYIVSLVVKDPAGLESRPDYAVVTITDAGAPVADAGSDQVADLSALVTLDGSDSYDPGGRALTYTWSLMTVPTGSASALSSSDSSMTTFTADKAGLYIASLVVNNGLTDSSPDTTVITVSSSAGSAPIANAGADAAVSDCMNATLDGSGSYDTDSSGDLDYLWSIQSKPSGSSATDSASFSNRNVVSPKFFPDVAGTYVISLTVFDGSGWSTPDTLTLTVSERTFNSEPVVEAGAGSSVAGGDADCEESGYTYDCDDCSAQTLTIGSDALISDGDGDPYTYSWSVVSGSASIADADSLVTTVTLSDAAPTTPGECEDNEYVLQLSATDCPGETATDTITLVVSCCGVEVTTDSASSAR